MAKTRIVRQLRHGQITIPKEFREALHLQPGDLLSVTLDDGTLRIEGVSATPRGPGSPWAVKLYELFAPTRESLKDYTEQEINDAIDEALRGYRAEKQ